MSKDKHKHKHSDYGRFCCCPAKVGLHLTGLISIGLLVYFFVLLVASAQNDRFNWLIIIWVFAVGFPRVILYFMTFADSIFRRRMYATFMTATTAMQLLFFIIDQFEIFMHDQDFCDRVYAVYYMKNDWDIKCDWSIVCYEICMVSALAYYIYAAVKAVGYFHLGFEQATLRNKEAERIKKRIIEDQLFEGKLGESKGDKGGAGGNLDVTAEKTIDNSNLLQN